MCVGLLVPCGKRNRRGVGSMVGIVTVSSLHCSRHFVVTMMLVDDGGFIMVTGVGGREREKECLL